MLPCLTILATTLVSPAWSHDARALAVRYAPALRHETRTSGANRTQDVPVPFDFDGDWDMRNNWAHQPSHAPSARPTVYFSAITTAARAYLTYFLFYPRDWSSICLPLVCHENDLEQFTLVVENDGSEFGRPLLADVKFHRGTKAYPVAGAGAKPRDETRARLSLDERGRPLLRVEWGGHGILSCDTDGDGRLDAACSAPGIVEYPPERYEFRSLQETLWPHRSAAHGLWEPDRLRYAGLRLGRLGAPLGISFAGSGLGGGARAPWGVRPAGRLHAGDRFFDPALAINERWRLATGPDTTRYLEHPWLDALTLECAGKACDGLQGRAER